MDWIWTANEIAVLLISVGQPKLEATLKFMVHLHCRTRIRISNRIRIPNQMATLYCAEHFTLYGLRFSPYFCIGQESQVCTRVRLGQCKWAISKTRSIEDGMYHILYVDQYLCTNRSFLLDDTDDTNQCLKMILDAFLQRLPTCVNRELIDKVKPDTYYYFS